MFRIFILIDEIYIDDIYPMLVKMSWSIKQIIFFSYYQRRDKVILDAFFKNSNARVEDILNIHTDGFDCVIYLWVTDTYDLKFSVSKPQ